MSLTIDQYGNDLNRPAVDVTDTDLTRLFEESLGLDPVVEGEDGPVVRAIVLYNPLDYTDRTVCDLAWRDGTPLSQYLDGLPDADWSVSISGRDVTRDEWDRITLAPLDTLIVGVTPNKSIIPIIMIVAMVALIALGPAGWGVLAGTLSASTVLIGTIAIGVGGYLLQSLLADKPKDQGTDENKNSQSYGLDGAKNTSQETLAVPVVYGTMRIAGNKTNVYVQNNPDKLTQTLFLQYVIGEGEIDDVTDVLLNEQPISNFQASLV